MRSLKKSALISLTLALAASLAAAGGLDASSASAKNNKGVSPVAARGANTATADALPTVQIDGVVWSQATVGNTVYAGGSFANARPAGAAPGTNLTPRANLLSYDITTGLLNTSFAPVLDGQVLSVAVSPDRTRVYVGGSFTTVNGQPHLRIAAFDATTGALISSFAPGVDASVNSISATNSVVYVGGVFSNSGGVARSHLAAFSASTGALLGWAPTTGGVDPVVNSVLVTPDATRVIVAGSFDQVNGATTYGVASLDPTTGVSYPYAVNQVVQNSGTDSAVLSLQTDGTNVYGAAYSRHAEFEGLFSVVPDTGAINWLVDCNGDSYGTYAANGTVYVVSHEHNCSHTGGFPATNPATFHRTTAFTTQATGHLVNAGAALTGEPSPSMVNWFPDMDNGNYTGQYQGAWSVTGTGSYVSEGGEFLHVNGTAQQGLVRFALQTIAPNKVGPDSLYGATSPKITTTSATSNQLSWLTDFDRDDRTLSYSLYRDDFSLTTPIYQTSSNSTFWHENPLSYTDTGLLPGKTYTYWVRATDPSGNTIRSANAVVTMPSA